MLTAPLLDDGRDPFDPDPDYHVNPLIRPSDHFLRLTAHRAAGEAEPPASDAEGNADEARAAFRAGNALFDDAAARNALTDLHEQAERFAATLAALPHREANSMAERVEKFLLEAKRALCAALDNNNQKRMFEHGFRAFSEGFRRRAATLREEKALAWRAEVTERQNSAFLAQALRPENVFADETQNLLRTMCLLNIDALCADLPETERRERLRQADRVFCRRILDKRLEIDPARLDAMLDAPAVRRTLGKELAREYGERAAAALRRDEVLRTGRGWFSVGLKPAEAKEQARTMFADEEERRIALEQYRQERGQAILALVEETVVRLDDLWREIAGSDAVDVIRLDSLRRSDPETAEHIEQALRARRRRGGLPPEPDLALLLEVFESRDPGRSLEALRDKRRLMDAHERLGGSGSPELGLCLRLLRGKATAADRGRMDGLRLVREELKRARGDGASEKDLAACLRRYEETMRLFLARQGYAEADPAEKIRFAQAAIRS